MGKHKLSSVKNAQYIYDYINYSTDGVVCSTDGVVVVPALCASMPFWWTGTLFSILNLFEGGSILEFWETEFVMNYTEYMDQVFIWRLNLDQVFIR